jgi:hypothetical protein
VSSAERGLGRSLRELLHLHKPVQGEEDVLEALFGGTGGPDRTEHGLAVAALDILLAAFPGTLCGACWDLEQGATVQLAGRRGGGLEDGFEHHLTMARQQPGLHRLRRPPAEIIVVPTTTLSLGARRLGWPFTEQECQLAKAVGRLLAVSLQA